MNVTGKINVFVEKRGNDNIQFNGYVGSIAHKHEDGSYTNARIEVVFDRKNFEDKLKTLQEGFAYTFNVKEGWLDCRAYKDKEGKERRQLMIYIKEADKPEKKKIDNDKW